MAPLRPALFLDRDGIINVDTNFLYLKEDVQFVDGIIPLIRHARGKGYAVIVVTNQSGIGRGYYTEDEFHTLMRWMEEELAAQGAALDAVYFSPFHPKHGIGHYKQETDCRKPGPGMLLRAAKEHHLDLARSIMIGDRCTDIGAAAAAGVPLRIFLPGTEATDCPAEPSYVVVSSLFQAIELF